MNENLDKLKMQETQQEMQHSPMEQLHVEKFLWKNMIDEYKPVLDNQKEDVTRQAWELSKEENGQPGSLPKGQKWKYMYALVDSSTNKTIDAFYCDVEPEKIVFNW